MGDGFDEDVQPTINVEDALRSYAFLEEEASRVFHLLEKGPHFRGFSIQGADINVEYGYPGCSSDDMSFPAHLLSLSDEGVKAWVQEQKNIAQREKEDRYRKWAASPAGLAAAAAEEARGRAQLVELQKKYGTPHN